MEMRRWFTFFDAGYQLNALWHSMLLALILQCLMCGEDPYALAAAQERNEAEGDSESDRKFRFKQFVLRVLFDPRNQQALRSVLVVYKRVRQHQVDV